MFDVIDAKHITLHFCTTQSMSNREKYATQRMIGQCKWNRLAKSQQKQCRWCHPPPPVEDESKSSQPGWGVQCARQARSITESGSEVGALYTQRHTLYTVQPGKVSCREVRHTRREANNASTLHSVLWRRRHYVSDRSIISGLVVHSSSSGSSATRPPLDAAQMFILPVVQAAQVRRQPTLASGQQTHKHSVEFYS